MTDAETLEAGFEAQAKYMREFGYTDVTAAMIADHHAAWQRGEEMPSVIFLFSRGAFEEYPSIFGERAK